MRKKLTAWLLCAVMLAVMLPAPVALADPVYDWTDISGNLNTASDVNLLDVSFIGDEVWIAGDKPEEVYHSVYGGESFTAVPLPAPADDTEYVTSIFMRAVDDVWMTTSLNGGGRVLHWDGMDLLSVSDTGVPLASIHFPPSGDIGYCCGSNGSSPYVGIIDTSVPSVATFDAPAGGPELNCIVFPVDQNTGWVSSFTDGSIDRYAGGAWSNAEPGPSCSFDSVCFADNSNGWAVGQDQSNYNAIIIHSTTGNSWSQQDLPTGIDAADVSLADVFFRNTQGWAVGTNYRKDLILYTNDSGDTWAVQYQAPSEVMLARLNAVYFDSNDVGYAVGNNKKIYKYTEPNTTDVPSADTGKILDLTATSVLILGDVTDDGGDTVTERGAVYSESPDPTISTGTVAAAAAAGIGAYSAAITGLSPDTTYYVRTYATNGAGTAYGTSRCFKTPVSVTTVSVGSMPKQAAINRVTNKIYVPNNLGNSVSVIDGDTDTVLTTISLGAGAGPYFAAVNETTNKIYIANNFGNSVSVIDGTDDTVITTVPTGSGPRAIAINETSNMIYVANYGASTVTVINGTDNTVSTTLDIGVGTRPTSLAVNETTNKLYTANYWNNTISVIDCTTGTIDAVIPASADQDSPRFVAVNEETDMIYVANFRSENVTVIDGADNSYTHVEVGADPWEIAVNKDTNKIYVSTDGETTISVLDGTTNDVQKASAGKAPQAVALNDKTNMIYVGNYNQDDRSTAGYVVTQIDGATLEAVGFADESNPSFLAVNSATNKVYVVNFNNTVTVIALSPPVSDYVCEIVGGAKYETLDEAIAAVPANTPTTIRLLKTIDRVSTLTLNGTKKITLSLNGHNLNITTASGAALEVKQNASLTTTGIGALNASGFIYGIYATEGAIVDITGNASATGGHSEQWGSAIGVYAYESDGIPVTVTVNGNVSGYDGVIVLSGAEVSINGNITAEHVAGKAMSGGSLTVSGDTSNTVLGTCIEVHNGTIHIGGNVTSTGINSSGIYAADGSVLTVSGGISAVYHGITAYNTDADIEGSVSTSSTISNYTAYAGNSAVINIRGDITGTGDCGAWAENSGKVTVTGTIQSCCTGIRVSNGGEVFALGNVMADNTVGVGANAYSAGYATIDGTIQANKAMIFGESDGALLTPTTKNGYLTYSDGEDYPSFIWIKDSIPVPPTTVTKPVESSGITQTSAAVSGNVTSAGSAAVTERGFVYGTTVNPAIGGAGVTKVTAGSGTGDFNATLSSLAAATTYHVRAYATSDAGTAYGEDRTFTTLSGGGNGDSNGGGEGGSNAPAMPAAQTYNAVVSRNQAQVATLPVTVASGATTGSVSLTDAKAAEYFAAAANTVILVPSVPNVDSYSLELPASSLTAAKAEKTLTFDTPSGSVSIPDNMLSSLSATDGKKAGITIGQGDKANLTDAEKAAIGDRPLIQLTLTLDGVQTAWNNPAAPVTVTIPYKPTAEELKNPESILVWYLDGSGRPVCIPNGHYDTESGTVTFKTAHFSKYAVGYNPVTFKDVAEGAWYHKAVSFIAARGITSGTGSGKYSPDAKLTRGEFIVMLMRAYDIAPDANPKDNFADAGSTWYTNYLAAAKRLGISAGIGSNMYAPEKEITRQEMFTLLYNALKVIGRLPEGTSGKSLSDYSDAAEIETWAKDAMKLLVETGTVSGSGGRLNPGGTTTRAEMAQVLYNLLMR